MRRNALLVVVPVLVLTACGSSGRLIRQATRDLNLLAGDGYHVTPRSLTVSAR